MYIYIYIYKAKCCIGRRVHIRPTAYRRLAVYFYVTDFPIMSNWNIVYNTNTHHILQYFYDIVINNIYTQQFVSLKLICLDAAYGRPVCNRKLVISYTYLQ